MKICIVTKESTVPPQIFDILENADCHITILSSLGVNQAAKKNRDSLDYVSINYSGPPISTLPSSLQSYYVLQWMLEHGKNFDLIFFPLLKGLGYYTLLAKHQGWAFQQTQFVVEGSSSTLWHKHHHNQWIDHLDELAVDFLEKESFSLADCAIISDRRLLNWMEEHGWKKPRLIVSSFDSCHLAALCGQQENDTNSLQQKDLPLVSVCITHFNRPHYLEQALASIRAQDYPHYEVIIVDDASTTLEAKIYLDSLEEEFQSREWSIIRNPVNLFPGAARNVAARHSKGEYLLFVDDDNYAKPNQINTFVQVALHTGADILTCAMDVFVSNSPSVSDFKLIHRFLPLGAAASVGLYVNMFGDMNAMIKKETFKALKGLTEEKAIGGEDWELFSRAVLQGCHLETIPLPLFWYRDTPGSITKTTHLYSNSIRGIRSYLDAVPPSIRSNLILSQAQQDKLQFLQQEYQHMGRLLRRIFHLFSFRAKKAMADPASAFKKVLKKF